MEQYQVKSERRQHVLARNGQDIAGMRQTKWFSSDAEVTLMNGQQYTIEQIGFWRQQFRVMHQGAAVAEIPFSFKKSFSWPGANGQTLNLQLAQQGFWRQHYQLTNGFQVFARIERSRGERWWQSVLAIETTEHWDQVAEPHLLLLCAARVLIAYQQAAVAAAV